MPVSQHAIGSGDKIRGRGPLCQDPVKAYPAFAFDGWQIHLRYPHVLVAARVRRATEDQVLVVELLFRGEYPELHITVLYP